MLKKALVVSSLGLASLVGFQGVASAGPLCNGTRTYTVTENVKGQKVTKTVTEIYDIRQNVEGAIGCYVADANQDSVDLGSPTKPKTLTVNDEKFFGYTDWKFDKKLEGGSFPTLANFLWKNDEQGKSGTYTLSPDALDYANIMFVFKGASDLNLVGYLLDPKQLDPLDEKRDFFSPFTKGPFELDKTKDISHISVYFRGDGRGTTVGDVPEPATAALFALGALGFVARRRKKL